MASIEGSLKRLIETEFVDTRSVPPMVAGGRVRISGVAKLCPREEAICAKEGLSRAEEIDAALGLIFAHGSALHWALQNEVLPKIGVLRGEWGCNRCGKSHGGIPKEGHWLEGMVFRPESCDCGSKSFTYKEQDFENTEFCIGGHPDGFLVIPGRPGVGILEAKSIGQVFKVRQTPLLDHVIQAQCYMWLTDLPWACILYWAKGASAPQLKEGETVRSLGDVITEHYVDRDEDTITEIKKTLLQLQVSLRDGTLPPRICATKSCDRAEECPLRDKCFSLT